jgi:NitT/TauT family transport system permease protein
LSRARSAFDQLWPRLAAIAGILVVWQVVYATGFFDPTVLPAPAEVLRSLARNLTDGDTGGEGILVALEKSLIRLAFGVTVAVIVGTTIGAAMAASRSVQRSIGSLMTGLQALPSISWLPLAILWFGLSERAIVFVVVIGAVPAVALATASSVRLVPPLLVRAGRTLGARRWELYRSVILPAAVPGYVAGLQQAWALAWRALMAGELIATGAQGLGHLQETARQQFDTSAVMAVMVVIILIGMAVDFGFGVVDRRVRARRGLLITT